MFVEMVMPLVIILNFIGAFGVNGTNVGITLFFLVGQQTLFFTIIHNNLSTLTVALTTRTKKLQKWSVIPIHSVFTVHSYHLGSYRTQKHQSNSQKSSRSNLNNTYLPYEHQYN